MPRDQRQTNVNPDDDDESLFDFLDDKSAQRSELETRNDYESGAGRRQPQPRRPQQGNRSSDQPLPIIRKPVCISRSGPLKPPRPGDPVEPPPPLTDPARKGERYSRRKAAPPPDLSDVQGVDLDFDLDVADADWPSSSEWVDSRPRPELPAGYDDPASSRGVGRVLGYSLGILLVAGGTFSALYSMPPVRQWADRTLAGLDDRSIDNAPITLTTTGSDAQVGVATPTFTDPAAPRSLYERFTETLDQLTKLMEQGAYAEARDLLQSMDRVVYGYGAPEFSEIEERLASLPSGDGQNLSPDAERQVSQAGIEGPDSAAAPDASAEQQAALEAERLAALEAERQTALEAERQAALEAERQAALEAERQAALEAERQAALEAERQAALEAERQAALEAERQAALEAERQAALQRQVEVEQNAARERNAASDDSDTELTTNAADDTRSTPSEDEQLRLDRIAQERARQEQLEIARQERERLEQLRAAQQAGATPGTAELSAESIQEIAARQRAAARAQRIAEASGQEISPSESLRLEVLEREALEREIQTAGAQAGTTRQPSTTVARAEIPTPATQPITDTDLQLVYGQFTQLEQAIESRDIDAVLRLTERSGARVQQVMQMFENNIVINARIRNVSTLDSRGEIQGILQITRLERADGSVTGPPLNLGQVRLSTVRDGQGWSRIRW